jgi:hypothetical protein
MPGFVEMRSGMAVPGGIAATDLATLHAHPQMNPGVSDLETLFATPGVWLNFLHMIFCVRALFCAHGNLSSAEWPIQALFWLAGWDSSLLSLYVSCNPKVLSPLEGQ